MSTPSNQDLPLLAAVTREEAALAILGERPGVHMTDEHNIAAGHPWAIAAMMATDADHARELALELADDLAKGMPAWRGWGIEYKDARP